MSAIAQVLKQQGHGVLGSDRSRDCGEFETRFALLGTQGVDLYPQDGSGVDKDIDFLVVSSAVEARIPDVQKALKLGVPIKRRAEVLAKFFNKGLKVAIGGTSGKTTVTGMVGHILKETGSNPTVVNGGEMLNETGLPNLGNVIYGDLDQVVIEADESDGTIGLYEPEVAVVTNVSLDHKPLVELKALFNRFCQNAKRAVVVNSDCEVSTSLIQGQGQWMTFGVENLRADLSACGIEMDSKGMRFQVGKSAVRIQLLGRHNVSNALAAISVCQILGVSIAESAEALDSFLGIRRRLEVVGRAREITVIDDYAHNPDKISASLETLKAFPGRLLVMFQPHGFGPTKFLKEGLISVFSKWLDRPDLLFMPKIYYAGGTTNGGISSCDLVDAICEKGCQAEFFSDRSVIADRLVNESEVGDRVVIMGARDESLVQFAQGILERIKCK